MSVLIPDQGFGMGGDAFEVMAGQTGGWFYLAGAVELSL
jgi:hypothetical protein